MAGQLSAMLIEILLEYEHSNPDPTFIVTLRIFYELAKNGNFVIAYFEKPGSNSSFQILINKVEELPFEDTDLLVLIFKIFYRLVKIDNAARLFDTLGGGIIPKIVDIISAH